MKTTHKLVKNSDFGKIAPGGRIESYWTDQNVNLDQTKIVNLVEEYKLAGIEFGNWVPQDERLLYVEDIYKGLPVFCKFLGIKHNQLGQNKITLAFGARGIRKAKAHWEPWSYAMNLTRKGGRRSFLHEYIHALDTILYDSLKNEYGTNPQRLFSAYFTTSGSGQFYLNNSRIFEQNLQRHITETGVRGAIARLLWNLCFYVDKKGDKVDVKWSKLYTNCKNNGEYWAYPWEILARSFESYFAHDFMAKKDDTNNAFKAVAKSTNFFSGKGVNTTVYPKATLVKELNMYFEDVMECFQWVLDAKEFGKPNKSEPKLAPKSSIINEATDLDLEKARKSRSEAIKKAEVKKAEVKKPEKKVIRLKKTETKKPEKKEAETIKTEEKKYNFDNMFETFKRGYYFISFSPDKRATEDVKNYNEILQSNIEKLKEFGASDEEINKYYTTFKTKLSEYYSALSRTLSSAVTGGAKFPVASNKKKQAIADKKYEELNKFLDSSMKYWEGKENREKRATPTGELEIAQSKVEELQKQLDTFTGINKIIRKFKKFGNERIVKEIQDAFNFKEDLAKGLLKPDYAGRIGIPDYQIANTRQSLNRYKKRVEDLSSKITKGTGKSSEIYGKIDNGYVQINYEMDRVQIVFDGKPSSDIIQKMKKNGWRWSPSNKQWQRKYTDQAISDLRRLFPELKKEEETKPESKSEISKKGAIDKPIFEDIIDAFINSMELFESAEEFANEFGTRPGKISKQWLKNAYDEYWKVDPMDRLKWDKIEWLKWISSNSRRFDKTETKTETKPETKTEITEEDFEFSSVLKYHMRVFTRWNINQLYNVKIEDIVDSLNDEFQNKKIPSWSSAINTLPDELREKTFKEPHDKDGQLFIQEFAWYCAVAGQSMFGNKPVKSVVDLIKKLGKPGGIDNTVFPFVKPRNFVKMNQQNVSIGFDDLKYIIDRMASDDQYRPAMMGIYYDVEDQNIVITDSYKLIIMPTKKFANSITNSLHENATTLIGVKGYKNFHKIDERFPPYKNVLVSDEDLRFIFWIDVDEELEKCKQLKFYTKFHSQLSTSKQFVKFSDDGDYFAMNFTYYQDVLETLKKLGKKQAQVFKENSGNGRIKGHYFVADDIKILLMPVRWNFGEDIVSIDPKLYQFSEGTPDNLKVIPMFDDEGPIDTLLGINNGLKSILKQLEKNEGLSDLDEKGDPKLFDNVSEFEETKSIEFLGDDITAPSLEVNSKYDLPAPMVNNNAEVVTVQQMRKNKIKPMQLPSKYKSLLGNVPNNFRMLLWGAPGHGKSSLALTIGNDIARKCKVLFVSAEESVQSATLQNRIKRFKANSRNLMFNDTTNPAIIESIIAKLNPKFIIIDSVNVIQGKVEAIIDLMLKYPDIGFIVIAQATKDHKRYSGLGSLAHAVDIVVNVKSGTATAEKNRYASLGSMPVKGITI